MLHGMGRLGGNILVKGAAENDVDRLGAATHPEQRKVSFQGQGYQFQLELGPLLLDLSQRRYRLFPIIFWMDVKISRSIIWAIP